MIKDKHAARRRQANLKQDFRVFVRLFPWWVAALLTLGFAAAAFIFEQVYNTLPGPDAPLTYVQAFLSLIKMLQFDYDVPAPAALDVFLVGVPLVGLPLFFLLGVNVVNVVRIFFMREERGQLWQATLASTFANHIVICGLGRVGYRLASDLAAFGAAFVGVNDAQSSFVDSLIDAGAPVIVGDARNSDVLRQAGVGRAKTVVVCTDQDLANIEAVFHVRELNPHARIVLRLFQDELAETIKAACGLEAVISRSALAALAIAHAAIGVEIIETFLLKERAYLVARAPVDRVSPLLGRTLAEVGATRDVSVIFHRRPGCVTLEPEPGAVLAVDDELFIFARAEQLLHLIGHGVFGSGPQVAVDEKPVIVCGLGHTGYRVVLNLLTLGQPVVAVEFEPDRLTQRLTELGVRVVFGDFRRLDVLARLGVAQAGALVACSEDDLTNLETALRAREVNPAVRVILRLFEERLGTELQRTFKFDAVYSTSALASPAFLEAALQVHVAQQVEVGGATFSLARLKVQAQSSLRGVTIAQLDREAGLTVALHARGSQVDIPPTPVSRLNVGDELVVLASQAKLAELLQRNHSAQRVVRSS